MSWKMFLSAAFSSAVGTLVGGLADFLITGGNFLFFATACGAAIGSAVGWYLFKPTAAGSPRRSAPYRDAEQS
jgi:hypothetical protein